MFQLGSYLTRPQLRKKSPDEATRRGRRDQEVRFQPNKRCEGIAPGIQEYLSRCGNPLN